MVKKPKKLPGDVVEPEAAKAARAGVVTLTEYFSERSQWQRFRQWIIGTSPLICHAWSEKAKQEMLAKMVKAIKTAKKERNPQEEFAASLYDLGDNTYGFPVTAVKKAILGQAHKDRGVAKTAVMAGLWLDFDMVDARPALAGALCNMPIVRLYGTKPIMREDMVRIGSGMSKKANFAYRAQFFPWAIRLTGKFNPDHVPKEVLAILIGDSGIATGIGDWRNEKSGIFGAYMLADKKTAEQWELFAAGKGPLPSPSIGDHLEAAE